MKVAIIGSRNLKFNIGKLAIRNTTAIISGGASGIDTCAKLFAEKNNIELIEYLPDYEQYGIKAPLIRNKLIVKDCDVVIAYWNGKSRGTVHTINYAVKKGKLVIVNIIK